MNQVNRQSSKRENGFICARHRSSKCRRVAVMASIGFLATAGISALPKAQEPDGERASLPAASNKLGVAQAPWPKFGGGASNAGLGNSKISGKAQPWSFAMFNKGAAGSPALSANGTAVFTAGFLYALDSDTGKRKWSLTSILANAGGGVIDAQNRLYVCGAVAGTSGLKHYVFALNMQTGEARWAFSMPHASFSTPALGANGLLYAQSCDGKLYAIDITTGKQRWAFAMQEPVFFRKDLFNSVVPAVTSAPAIGPDGTVYTSYDRLYAVDGATGQQKWVAGTANLLIGGFPAIRADGTVYVGATTGKSGQILALDGATGKPKWAFPTAATTFYAVPALDMEGAVYMGSQDGTMYAVDAETGTFRWRFNTGSNVYCAPTVGADHTVYFGDANKRFYALDSRAGNVKWTTQLTDRISISSALGSNGLIYVPTQNGWIYALRAADGAQGRAPLSPQ